MSSKISQEQRDDLCGLMLKLKHDGVIYDCVIRGRLNNFATVYIVKHGRITDTGWAFSWDTIYHAANTDATLTV